MQQKRLVIALLISTAILFLWSYLAPVKPPPTPPPSQSTSQPKPSPSAAATPVLSSSVAISAQVNSAPHRTVSVKTPLYEAKLDSEGAAAVSWIIKKNKDSGRDIYSVAGDQKARIPLELISPKGLERQPREAPLQLITGDSAIDAVLTSANYSITSDNSTNADADIVLQPGEKRRLEFVLADAATGLNVSKVMIFDGDDYSVDMQITVKRGDQVVPQARLRVGPSIGDQGVKKYSFYSVAPEAIVAQADKVQRHQARAINENKNSPDRMSIGGPVDWAGVGDTYFAMVAVPAKRLEGLELHTSQYDHTENGKPEKRYLTTAWVPVSTDGSHMIIYAGPKDHYLLTQASANLSQVVGRNIDLEGLIDYGIAIILFTIVIYSLFFPLKWRSSKSMKKAQKLAPRMKELQEKIKGMK